MQRLTGFAAVANHGDQLNVSRGDMLQQSTLRRANFFPEARRLTDALSSAGEPLLFGIRLWASVCLALYVAF